MVHVVPVVPVKRSPAPSTTLGTRGNRLTHTHTALVPVVPVKHSAAPLGTLDTRGTRYPFNVILPTQLPLLTLVPVYHIHTQPWSP